MPWRELSPMDEKVRFIEAFRSGVFRFAELCAFFDISRKTGYKWVGRWKEQGRAGLEDRSHAVRCCPHGMREDVAAVLLAIRRKHRGWGPAKLLRIVHKRRPSLPLPARSTTAARFKRHGLVEQRFWRYCLACVGLPSTKHELVEPLLERAFREYGLPDVIRTDNGAPFASQAIHRLSRLHVWWIKIGVYPELILPA